MQYILLALGFHLPVHLASNILHLMHTEDLTFHEFESQVVYLPLMISLAGKHLVPNLEVLKIESLFKTLTHTVYSLLTVNT